MSTLLEQASLVMIPSGYKEDVVYSQIPTNGNGDLSFTRASNGTRINSAGLVEVCPWNNWTGSDNFSSTYWTGYALTPTTGTTSDIYGNSSTVYKLIGSVTNSYCFINRISGGSQNTAFSVYAKPNGYTKIGISNRSGGAWNFVVDLVTKVVSNISDSTSSILSINVIDAVGDWKRIEVVVSSAIQYNLHPLPSNFNSTDFDNVTLNGTDGVWVMASQVNIGSTAKPYFPTTDRLNVPRLTYQNGGGGCPSLLLEKQSTNICLYSQDISNTSGSYWGDGSSGGTAVATANYATSPDGTQNATRLQLNEGSLYSVWQQVNFTTPSTSYTYSIWMKAVSGTPTIVFLYDGTGNRNITLTNEWVRYTWTFTAGSTTIFRFGLWSSVWGTSSTADILAWGAQCEISSYSTSYIPTTSSSATRVADACFKTGIGSLFGSSYTLFGQFVNLGINNTRLLTVKIPSGGNYDNFITIYQSGTGLIATGNNASSVEQFNISSGSYSVGQILKFALRCVNNDVAFYINGTQIGTDTSATIPAVTAIYVGNYVDIIESSIVNQVVVFNSGLTNTQLSQLTA